MGSDMTWGPSPFEIQQMRSELQKLTKENDELKEKLRSLRFNVKLALDKLEKESEFDYREDRSLTDVYRIWCYSDVLSLLELEDEPE